ncbi:MAG TPA: TetR/AcrR family transcriptional regulator [Spirochaetota bacterium]|nr:TetR/AcrR family transcriptional regulator [Spirochaetota bacterium]HRZ28402.1 TetR/AcrR family transcriptional regulator [Spirochaetota bacterium]HSA16570.1 TetR/AcrR family transcriptional regulator [Spirochaetota bacterium]
MNEEKDNIIREAILDAAGILFQKWGLNKTTMEDIAKAAGKGKSTIYYYYKSKEDIFMDFAARLIESLIRKAKDQVDNKKTAQEKLKVYLLTIFEELKNTSSLYEIVRGELVGNNQVINQIRTSLDTQEIEMINDILSYGIKNNEFIHYSPKDVLTMSSIVVSAIRGLHMDLFLEKKIMATDKLDLLIEIFLRGIRK